MSLGISFSFQGFNQSSTIDVNGKRMTSSAGGQDDGGRNNGELLTVGGLDDSNANPPDPFAIPDGNPRIDDELYNLKPFVSNGDTSITVNTTNVSGDDNIFFAALNLKSTIGVEGEGILLTPLTATNTIGTEHTITAMVQDDKGNPIVNRNVTIKIVSGPHTGRIIIIQTEAGGKANFTYTGTSIGIDVIEASFINDQGATITSNNVTKEWLGIIPQSGAPSIMSFDPLSPVNDTLPITRTFNIGINQTVNVTWFINGMQVQTNMSVTDARYINKSAVQGTWNVTAVAMNSNGSAVQTWVWIVRPKGSISVKINLSGITVIGKSTANILEVIYSNFDSGDAYNISIMAPNGSRVYFDSGNLSGADREIIPIDWTPKNTGNHTIEAWGRGMIDSTPVYVFDLMVVNPPPVPELGTIILITTGLLGLIGIRMRYGK